MERDESTLRRLVEWLRSHGYPAESLAIEYPVGFRYLADLAVIDPETLLPIALFELKQERNPRSAEVGRTQLRSFVRALRTQSVQTYLVWKTDGAPFFEIERIYVDDTLNKPEVRIRPGEIAFEIQSKVTRGKLAAEKRRGRDRLRGWLIAACIAIAVILIVLLVLDLFDQLILGPSKLVLLGGAIVVVLIPFYDKVKIFNVELERLVGRRKEKD